MKDISAPIRKARYWSNVYLKDTGAKTRALYLLRQVRKRFLPWVPIQLYLGVTYRCQCRCLHCAMGPRLNDQAREMTDVEIKRLIVQARQIGVIEVIFFGGEPLMRPGITDLIRFTRSQGLLPVLFTNGIQLTPTRVRELKDAGLHQANISLDSGDPQVHDQNRRFPGCFDRAVAGIRNLVDQQIKCTIWTFANRDKLKNDLKDMRDLVAVGKDLKVDRIIVLFPIATGNWVCAWEEILTPAERLQFRTIMDWRFVLLEFYGENAYCRAGKKVFYISPEGDVFPCPGVPLSYGHAVSEHMLKILRRMHKDLGAFSCRARGDCIMQDPEFRARISEDPSSSR